MDGIRKWQVIKSIIGRSKMTKPKGFSIEMAGHFGHIDVGDGCGRQNVVVTDVEDKMWW